MNSCTTLILYEKYIYYLQNPTATDKKCIFSEYECDFRTGHYIKTAPWTV